MSFKTMIQNMISAQAAPGTDAAGPVVASLDAVVRSAEDAGAKIKTNPNVADAVAYINTLPERERAYVFDRLEHGQPAVIQHRGEQVAIFLIDLSQNGQPPRAAPRPINQPPVTTAEGPSTGSAAGVDRDAGPIAAILDRERSRAGALRNGLGIDRQRAMQQTARTAAMANMGYDGRAAMYVTGAAAIQGTRAGSLGIGASARPAGVWAQRRSR